MTRGNIPNLDELCGRHFRFRDFAECGETQETLGIANKPKQPESYEALRELAVKVLDPVIDHFGMIDLTFGICSSKLASKIPGRIAPDRDQHASFELNSRGNRICTRDGAAVDFLLEGRDMFEVAQWIINNLDYDRIYFYGPDRPIHVSYSSSPRKEVTVLKQAKSTNRRIPRSYKGVDFAELESSPI